MTRAIAQFLRSCEERKKTCLEKESRQTSEPEICLLSASIGVAGRTPQ